ncbi:FUSC family protein [Hafnia alvei]|uniref:FUSC family protein n=1 Tax=Hafnia alvei TaxID=569 RepID=A0ABD7Q0Z3_HAFAL|nr:FUSC family protein [Hafnia alvei]NEY27756.1 FUSC family protein [Escherichia coli]ANC41932.1 fusaric acid resistance protein [Hafnia alvei]KAA0263788.1 FUSC family protein [Hafnia alvei]TBL66514.1 FUSC family protein [Hafnia alvei]STQ70934.1 p-hydroxybenzoic acid efflux pump subunit AaeB [Hafnia alvei]
MNLSWLDWRNTPWAKANAGQWRYALRNAIAMCLALWVAFLLDLDEPYWAFTSAAVVSFPTVGGVISKSIGRIAGSLLGAAASVLIAGQCLNDPWLFTFYIAAWIAVCTYVSNHYQNNVAYAFALAGYTAAIIAFSTAESTDSMQIFDIAQARVCEVITGLLCGAFMMMLLPSTSDGTNLLTSLRRMHQRLLEHAAMLWHPETTPEMRASHEGLIGQILTMNILRIQAFWSNHRLRSRNNVLNFLLHRQLRLTSVISSIRRMLVNWPDRPDALQDVLRDIIKELQDPETNKYRLAKILSRIYPQDPSDYRLRTFYLRLRYFCWLYLQGSRWIQHVENSTPEDSFSPPKVHSIARHTDSMESAYNALRTFVVIIIGCAFWMSTQWDEGAGALTITAITCVLYSTSASPMTSLTTLFKAMVLLSIGCYLAKFGLMIQIDDFWVFCAFLLPVLLTMQLLKLQNPKTAALWGQVIVFMGSFLLVTNPPEYDYGSFVNDNIAKICGVLLAAVAFQILRPSSDKRKSRRIIRALRLDFMDQISRHPQQDESQFESRIYHRISQLNQSKDEVSRIWVLRWGVVLLNCSHIVWQLREWQTRSDPLSAVRDVCIHCLKGIMTEKGVQHESLDGTLAELLRISDVLSRHPDQSGRDLAGLVWRLYCSLSQLQQSVVSSVTSKP